MKTYVCTCGTSIATKQGISLERFLNAPMSEWAENKDYIEAVKYQIRDRLAGVQLSKNLDDTSAEIKSLVKMGLEKEDEVILISSNTIDGRLCAESVKEFLIDHQLISENSVKIKEIPGLQAADGKKFQKQGLKNLLTYLVSLEYQNVVFNPTGGFKSIVPYVALMGMIFNKPVKYIHEDSEDVLTLTGIPLLLDDDLMLAIETKLIKIEEQTEISLKEWQEGIDNHDNRFDCCIEEENGHVTLSGIGLLFWERFKKDFPASLKRDNRVAFEKENKLFKLGVSHHGIEKLIPISKKLLGSPFVKSVPDSCNNQPKSKAWVKPLTPEEAKTHIQREAVNICIITDVRSDAGYSFLIETTARDCDENEQIAAILNRKYFN
jgi:putative CRISPR-associated protein (TIGR02619 family)